MERKMYQESKDFIIAPFRYDEFQGKTYATKAKIFNLELQQVKYWDSLTSWGDALVVNGFLESGCGRFIAFADENYRSVNNWRNFSKLRDALFERNIVDIVKAAKEYRQLKMVITEKRISIICLAIDDGMAIFQARRIDTLPLYDGPIHLWTKCLQPIETS